MFVLSNATGSSGSNIRVRPQKSPYQEQRLSVSSEQVLEYFCMKFEGMGL